MVKFARLNSSYGTHGTRRAKRCRDPPTQEQPNGRQDAGYGQLCFTGKLPDQYRNETGSEGGLNQEVEREGRKDGRRLRKHIDKGKGQQEGCTEK